jgi:hypothetical protein
MSDLSRLQGIVRTPFAFRETYDYRSNIYSSVHHVQMQFSFSKMYSCIGSLSKILSQFDQTAVTPYDGTFKLDFVKCTEVLNAYAFGKSRADEIFGC